MEIQVSPVSSPPSALSAQECCKFCLHCNQPLAENQDRFCCSGCKTAYELIHASGLDEFYQLRNKFAEDAKTKPVGRHIGLSYFSDPLFSADYLRPIGKNCWRANFYLDGIHCFACVWLLERLPEFCEGVYSARVNLPLSTLQIEFEQEKTTLADIANCVQALGYTVHPLRNNEREEQHRLSERTILLRLGVAAVASMNTMLLAVSVYQGWFSGMDSSTLNFFSVVSWLLSLPAVTFSAAPMYRSAWSGLKRFSLHIDLPLSIAILFGFLLSSAHTVSGNPEVYYDTVTMLIFLLLAARYLQQRMLNESASRLSLFGSLSPLAATRVEPTGDSDVYIERVTPGDRLRVCPGDIIPVDGVIECGTSSVDQSLLTGESDRSAVRPGSPVFGGTINCNSEIIIRATHSLADSEIGKLIDRLENPTSQKSNFVELSDSLTKWFVVGVISLAICGGSYWYLAAGTSKAFSVVLALLVVSCPCALALAVPLAYSALIRSSARNGIFLRDNAILEGLAQIRTIVFDKTGVLTGDRLVPQDIHLFISESIKQISLDSLQQPEQNQIRAAIYALEVGIRHPIAKTLLDLIAPSDVECPKAEDRIQLYGKGVQGVVQGVPWVCGSKQYLEELQIPIHSSSLGGLSRGSFERTTEIYLARAGVLVALIRLGNEIRPGMQTVIRALQKRGLKVEVLSGDREDVTISVANSLQIRSENVKFQMSPLQKAEEIERLKAEGPVLMIGDGANDCAALQAASIGIAVGAAPDAALRVASASISPFSPEKLENLFIGIARMNRVIRLNFGMSVLYNLVGATFALAGLMNPLIAAVLMPLSSITVIFTTLRFSVYEAKNTATPDHEKTWR